MQLFQELPDYPAHPPADSAQRPCPAYGPEPENNPFRGIQVFMDKVVVTSPIPYFDYGKMAQHVAEHIPESQVPERLSPEARLFPDDLQILVGNVVNPLQQFSFPV